MDVAVKDRLGHFHCRKSHKVYDYGASEVDLMFEGATSIPSPGRAL